LKKRIIGILLALVIISSFVAPTGVMAATTELVTMRVGEVWEFRNTSDRTQRLTIIGDNSASIDFIVYNDTGRAVRQNSSGTGRGRNSSLAHFVQQNISRDGKLVIELREGSAITAEINLDVFVVQRLQTPVFYVEIIGPGASAGFTNRTEHTARIDWILLGASIPGGRMERYEIFSPSGDRHSGGTAIARRPTLLPGYRLVLTAPSGASARSAELWGDHAAFTDQPYRLTIDGQRSFPPGMGQDLPPAVQPPTNNENITLNDIAGFSPAARQMFNMIIRTNHSTRPFGNYTRAIELTRGSQSGNNVRMQYAYVRTLEALLDGRSNTHLERHDAMRDAWIGMIPALGKVYSAWKIVAGLSGGLSPDMQLAAEQLTMLWMIHDNTTDSNLQAAVRSVIYNRLNDEFIYLYGVVATLDAGEKILHEAISKGIDAFAGIKGIGTLVKVPLVLNRMGSDSADRIFAQEGIIQALRGAYGQIITQGRTNNQYSEAALLTAHNLFMVINYLLGEQHLWATSLHDTHRLLGGLNQDARLHEEARQISWSSAPAWYPYAYFAGRDRPSLDEMGRVQGATVASHDPSGWAREQVRAAIDLGIVPQNLRSYYTQAITRAEFAALAVAFYERQRGTITGRVVFADTSDVNVQKAAHIGVLQGVGNNNFDPNRNLTRAEAAVMLVNLANAVGNPLPRSTPNFLDYRMFPSWAVDAIGQVQAAGIMTGSSGYTIDGQSGFMFGSSADYTREQSIVTMMRLLDLV